MISTRRFVAVMMASVLLLALTFVSATEAPMSAEPGAKWNAPPAAVVVQTCGVINAVLFTTADGKLTVLEYASLSTESLRLYLNRIEQVKIVNVPCIH